MTLEESGYWANIATIFLVIITALTLIVIAIQAWLIKSESKLNRTLAHLEKLMDPSFMSDLTFTLAILSDTKKTEAERWKSFNLLDYSQTIRITRVLNTFDVLGGLYKAGLLDKDKVKSNYGYSMSKNYKELEWFIYKIRKESNEDFFYQQWEEMVKKMQVKT